METFRPLESCIYSIPLRSQSQLLWAGLLLISTFSLFKASPISNATSDHFSLTDPRANETCSNITIYNAIENERIPFIEVKLNLTSRQLKFDVTDAAKVFNDFYFDQTIEFVLNANPAAETNTNDVCQHKIPVKLSLNKSGFKCPWEYKCDYDPRRIPQVMWQADCSQYNTWQCSCPDETAECSECVPINRKCETVYYPVPILYNSKSCSPFGVPENWSWRQMKIAVGCACNNEISF